MTCCHGYTWDEFDVVTGHVKCMVCWEGRCENARDL